MATVSCRLLRSPRVSQSYKPLSATFRIPSSFTTTRLTWSSSLSSYDGLHRSKVTSARICRTLSTTSSASATRGPPHSSLSASNDHDSSSLRHLFSDARSALHNVPKPFMVTTPIFYVNDKPHLGHAYTSVACDVIARFMRLDGRNVFFLTGTDEHGQKVEQSAARKGLSPQVFADQVSGEFRKMMQVLHISADDFIRTTEDRHIESVKVLWQQLVDRGYIYLGAYEGWYSVRDEAFYSATELVEGKAPTGADVEWVKEESYFFKLSAFQEELMTLYTQHPDFVGPTSRRNETMSFVKQGLRDLSISRTTFEWGIRVPNNDAHVIYVWLDALTNYISALGYGLEHFASVSHKLASEKHLPLSSSCVMLTPTPSQPSTCTASSSSAGLTTATNVSARSVHTDASSPSSVPSSSATSSSPPSSPPQSHHHHHRHSHHHPRAHQPTYSDMSSLLLPLDTHILPRLSSPLHPSHPSSPPSTDKLHTFWPSCMHMVGKDILRFHAVYWPAFLLAAGLPPPKRVFAHGWWTKDGEKMSKSLGNVIDPLHLVDLYGVDCVRYFMMAEVHMGNDGDFSHGAMVMRCNTHLANSLGNLISRTLTLVHKHCDGKVPEPEGGLGVNDYAVLNAGAEALAKARISVDEQALDRLADECMEVVRIGNKYIADTAPWTLAKKKSTSAAVVDGGGVVEEGGADGGLTTTLSSASPSGYDPDVARMKSILFVLCENIRQAAVLLQPLMPESSDKILTMLGIANDGKNTHLNPNLHRHDPSSSNNNDLTDVHAVGDISSLTLSSNDNVTSQSAGTSSSLDNAFLRSFASLETSTYISPDTPLQKTPILFPRLDAPSNADGGGTSLAVPSSKKNQRGGNSGSASDGGSGSAGKKQKQQKAEKKANNKAEGSIATSESGRTASATSASST